jgi:cyclohexanecarboxylate-CoA ligase
MVRHPAVAGYAIVPAPDTVLGERTCCFVVLAEMPMTPTRKVMKGELAKRGATASANF